MKLMPLSFYSDKEEHVPLKVSLFMRTHEMKKITDHLMQVSKMANQERKAWLDEYEDVLHDNLEEFTDYLSLEVTKSEMDNEMLRLVMEYTQSLQDFTSVMHSLFAGEQEKQKTKRSSKPKAIKK